MIYKDENDFWEACRNIQLNFNNALLKAEVTRLRADNERLAASVSKSNNDNRVLQQMLSDSYKDYANLKGRHTCLEHLRTNYLTILKRKDNEINELTSVIEDISVNNDRLEDKIEALEGDVEALESDIEALENDVESQEVELKSLEVKLKKKNAVDSSIFNCDNIKVFITNDRSNGTDSIIANCRISAASYHKGKLEQIHFYAKDFDFSSSYSKGLRYY
jgi:predicted nuclease with TOPRIM domain